MSGQEFLILAAGRGERFAAPGTVGAVDKLRVRVGGESLPQRAVAFAAANGARRVLVTLAGGDVGERVLADVEERAAAAGLAVIPRRQDPDLYGPGAALLPWRGDVDGPLVVLFGDNLYVGTLPVFPDPGVLYFTFSERGDDEGNLRLAAVVADRIVEKPHRFSAGRFFTGLLRLPAGFLASAPFDPSRRGEIEIADAANAWPVRVPVRLDPSSLLWGDLTVPVDVAALEALLEAGPTPQPPAA